MMRNNSSLFTWQILKLHWVSLYSCYIIRALIYLTVTVFRSLLQKQNIKRWKERKKERNNKMKWKLYFSVYCVINLWLVLIVLYFAALMFFFFCYFVTGNSLYAVYDRCTNEFVLLFYGVYCRTFSIYDAFNLLNFFFPPFSRISNWFNIEFSLSDINSRVLFKRSYLVKLYGHGYHHKYVHAEW